MGGFRCLPLDQALGNAVRFGRFVQKSAGLGLVFQMRIEKLRRVAKDRPGESFKSGGPGRVRLEGVAELEPAYRVFVMIDAGELNHKGVGVQEAVKKRVSLGRNFASSGVVIS